MDHVDAILEQWGSERPDLDLSGMAIIGRISRLERSLAPRLAEVFARHGLESWEFDLLATLRRSGEPHRMTAGELLDSMMITSGAVTNRIDRLEARGLVAREKDPADGRRVLVALTKAGFRRADAAVSDHAANEAALLDGLSGRDQQQFQRLLRLLDEKLTDLSRVAPRE